MSAKTAPAKGALRSLSVEGFGLIERTATDLGPGLNAFTGETGSGKSMVIDALGFAFGDRGGPDIVRSGAKRAAVFVEVEVSDEIALWLAESGFSAFVEFFPSHPNVPSTTHLAHILLNIGFPIFAP